MNFERLRTLEEMVTVYKGLNSCVSCSVGSEKKLCYMVVKAKGDHILDAFIKNGCLGVF